MTEESKGGPACEDFKFIAERLKANQEAEAKARREYWEAKEKEEKELIEKAGRT